MLDFRKIKFGEVSGEIEASDDPELLLKGYFDINNITEIVKNNHKFFFSGTRDLENPLLLKE